LSGGEKKKFGGSGRVNVSVVPLAVLYTVRCGVRVGVEKFRLCEIVRIRRRSLTLISRPKIFRAVRFGFFARISAFYLVSFVRHVICQEFHRRVLRFEEYRER
jgi:hypothetical protein